MAAFIKLETQSGHAIVINVDQIAAIEPLLDDPAYSVIRLAVSQSIRNQQIGILELSPQSYVVRATVSELQEKMSIAANEFFA